MSVNPDTPVVSEYLSWLVDVRHRQPSTVRTYRSTIEAWLAWLSERGKVLATASLQDVEDFQIRPRTLRGAGGNGSAATQRREIACLRMLHSWLHLRGHVETDATAEAFAPTVKGRQPKPVPDGTWRTAWTGSVPNSLRTAMGLGFFCGLRRAEIVSLTVDQLTSDRIVNFVRKGGGEDTLPWRSLVQVYEQHLPHLEPERFLAAIEQSKRNGSGRLVLGDGPWMNYEMRKHGMPFTPHNLRHSAATNLIRAGVPLPIVSRMMNHASITTTMLYVKAGGDELRDWLKA